MACWARAVMLAVACWAAVGRLEAVCSVATPVGVFLVEEVVETLMGRPPETASLPGAGLQLLAMSPGVASPQGSLEERWAMEVSKARRGSSVAPVAFSAEEGSWAAEGCWEAAGCSASWGKEACSARSRGSPGKEGSVRAPCRGSNL